MALRRAPSGGQIEYTTPGTYSWAAPAGVTSVSVVCIGGGGSCQNANGMGSGSGSGGALRYTNSISVTPGETLTVIVTASGGVNTTSDVTIQRADATILCKAYGGITTFQSGGVGGTGDGGGNGGIGRTGYYGCGGGGAGGYSAQGGSGGMSADFAYDNWGSGGTSGGTTGGNGTGQSTRSSAGGNGTGQSLLGSGGGGSLYGGGRGSLASQGVGGGNYDMPGTPSACRIIWPGNVRVFPSTRTGNE